LRPGDNTEKTDLILVFGGFGHHFELWTPEEVGKGVKSQRLEEAP
jgi:hypothetical protein